VPLGSACSTCECLESSCEPCLSPSECANCASCCCSPTHLTWRERRIGQGLTLEYFSLGWMGIEVVGSIGIGLLSGSLALLAFGSDSLVELLSGFAVALHLRSDSSRSKGLGERTERLSKFLLVALLPVIGMGAGYSFLSGFRPESSLLGIAVALGAVLVMPVFWIQKKRIGRETNCAPLSMDAVQSATCFLMSVALLGGLVVNYLFGFGWVDYVATAIILGFVAKEVLEAFHPISQSLTRERRPVNLTVPVAATPNNYQLHIRQLQCRLRYSFANPRSSGGKKSRN
jgi:divalent metal cation (Fe/Co/Zn/Cd) transporter